MKVAKAAKAKEKVNPFGAMRNFLQEVGQEQKKIVWPTREVLTQSTMIVVFIIVVLTIYLGIVDMICRKVFDLIS